LNKNLFLNYNFTYATTELVAVSQKSNVALFLYLLNDQIIKIKYEYGKTSFATLIIKEYTILLNASNYQNYSKYYCKIPFLRTLIVSTMK